MPQVRIPNVGVVSFPEGMPPEQIEQQAYKMYLEAVGFLPKTVYDPNRAVLTGKPPKESYDVPVPAPAQNVPELFNLAPSFTQRLQQGPIGPGGAPVEIGLGLLEATDIGGRAERMALTGKPSADTGSFLGDVATEVATDPITQASLLAASPLVAARASLKQILKRIGGKGVKETGEKALKKGAPEVIKEFMASRIKAAVEPRKLVELNLDIKPYTGAKYAGSINLNRLKIPDDAKAVIEATTEKLKPELEVLKGAPLTHKEVIQAAKEAGELPEALRSETVDLAARITAAKERLNYLATRGIVDEEFIALNRAVSSQATKAGRILREHGNDFEIGDPARLQKKMIKALDEMGFQADRIIKEAEGVDWANTKQVEEFYRKFVEPTWKELFDTYRYYNLLSSVGTHIVNTSSNLIQSAVLAPGTHLAAGVVDNVAAKLTGKARSHYIKETPLFLRGMLNSIPDAIDDAGRILRGESMITRPDVGRIGVGGRFRDLPFSKSPKEAFTNLISLGRPITKALEASDVFFRTLLRQGEEAALTAKYAGAKTAEEISEEAASKGQYYIFRGGLDPSNEMGQGVILSNIDKLTGSIYKAREFPGIGWVIPFVETVTNIVKQGFEYSPTGVLTLWGAADKVEQLGKASLGSAVFAGAGYLALQGRTTWRAPLDEKAKAEFYAAGRKPFSIRIGDQEISYSRLGPLAYPIAMAAAIQYEFNENPKSVNRHWASNLGATLMAMGSFFSDQSYVAGVGDIIHAVEGRPGAVSKSIANFPNQLIPLSSLQRWVGNIIDPVYRKAEKGLSPEGILDNIRSTIAYGPWSREQLPTYRTSEGQPSERQMPILNAFSPVQIGTIQAEAEARYQEILEIQRLTERLRQEKEEASEEIKDKAAVIAKEVQGMTSTREIMNRLNSIEDNLVHDLAVSYAFPVEAKLAGAPTAVKAAYIMMKEKTMSDDEASEWRQGLAARGILTTAVLTEMIMSQEMKETKKGFLEFYEQQKRLKKVQK